MILSMVQATTLQAPPWLMLNVGSKASPPPRPTSMTVLGMQWFSISDLYEFLPRPWSF